MAPIPKGVNKVGILTALGSAGLLVFAFLALSSGVNGSKYGANLFSLSDLLITAAIIAFLVAGFILVSLY